MDGLETVTLQWIDHDLHGSYAEQKKSTTTNKDYDPHKERNVMHPTSNFATLVHVLKGMIGSGILAMPKAWMQAGYVLAATFSIVMGILLVYCIHLLIRAQYILCKRRRLPILSYPLTLKLALEEGPARFKCIAPYAVGIVSTFLTIFQLGICTAYMLFISINMRYAIYGWTEKCLPRVAYLSMLLVPLLLLMMIRNLQLLLPVSIIATIVEVAGTFIIMGYLFHDGVTAKNEIVPVGKIADVPIFIGTILFAFVGIGLLISLENNMKTPKAFVSKCGVLNVGMSICIIFNMIFAFMGYLRYGIQVKDSITLNLLRNNLTRSIQVLFCVSLTATYPLQSYVVVDLVWINYLKEKLHRKYHLFGEYLVRLLIVMLTYGLAAAIPHFELLIALVGSFTMSMLALSVPAFIDICVSHPSFGLYKIVIIRNVAIIIVGIFALIIGTAVPIMNMIMKLFEKQDFILSSLTFFSFTVLLITLDKMFVNIII